MVADEDFALHISDKLPLNGVAPLLCAGITTYSPLRHWKVGREHTVGILGLGGLGHMAVKFAVSFGAEVTMLSTSLSKEKDAKRLGAHKFLNTKDEKQMKEYKNYFDVLLNTVSANVPYEMYLKLLNLNGKMIIVGLPSQAPTLSPFTLLNNRRTIIGSMIGGMPETQEMLDYCAEKNIVLR